MLFSRHIFPIVCLITTSLSAPNPHPVPQLFDSYCVWNRASDKTKDTFFRSQLTEKIDCSSAKGCGTTHLEQRTFGYSVAVGANTPFNSVGFGVTQEWTSGEEYSCEGETGDIVCVWVKIKYIEYDVEPENCDGESGVRTLRAPAEGTGTGKRDYYCVTGKYCRTLGEGYWSDEP